MQGYGGSGGYGYGGTGYPGYGYGGRVPAAGGGLMTAGTPDIPVAGGGQNNAAQDAIPTSLSDLNPNGAPGQAPIQTAPNAAVPTRAPWTPPGPTWWPYQNIYGMTGQPLIQPVGQPAVQAANAPGIAQRAPYGQFGGGMGLLTGY